MIWTDFETGRLSGVGVETARRTVGDLRGYWLDAEAAERCADDLLYTTQTWMAAPDGTSGAVLWGNTELMPGKVGDEFFMTRGHWHVKPEACELCVTVSGRGALVLMDRDRNTRIEPMEKGSTHYVDGSLAHRTVNLGEEPLVFLCAWPADCGHEYASILRHGFSERLLAR